MNYLTHQLLNPEEINLIRKTIVRYEREMPKIRSKIRREFKSKEITII